MALNIKKQLRAVPQVGVPPYRQVHAHSTGNSNSTAQNEADYYSRKEPTLGTFSHVVGNGQIIQVSETGHGFWDVGGGWNYESYAAVELIESHKSKEEFLRDYKLYVDLLRQLAKEAGLPTTLDTGDTGIISHNYATHHQPDNHSDHVDPYPYLAKWGISKEQFAKDLSDGFGDDNSIKKTALSKNNLEEEKDYMHTMIQAVHNTSNKTIYIVNFSTGIYHGLNGDQWKKVKATHKYITGKEINLWDQSKAEFDLMVSTYSLIEK